MPENKHKISEGEVPAQESAAENAAPAPTDQSGVGPNPAIAAQATHAKVETVLSPSDALKTDLFAVACDIAAVKKINPPPDRNIFDEKFRETPMNEVASADLAKKCELVRLLAGQTGFVLREFHTKIIYINLVILQTKSLPNPCNTVKIQMMSALKLDDLPGSKESLPAGMRVVTPRDLDLLGTIAHQLKKGKVKQDDVPRIPCVRVFKETEDGQPHARVRTENGFLMWEPHVKQFLVRVGKDGLVLREGDYISEAELAALESFLKKDETPRTDASLSPDEVEEIVNLLRKDFSRSSDYGALKDDGRHKIPGMGRPMESNFADERKRAELRMSIRRGKLDFLFAKGHHWKLRIPGSENHRQNTALFWCVELYSVRGYQIIDTIRGERMHDNWEEGKAGDDVPTHVLELLLTVPKKIGRDGTLPNYIERLKDN